MAARSHSPPPSPRTLAEKPDRHDHNHSKRSHHVRRKSGNPPADKKKPVLPRRSTPQHLKTLRSRDRESHHDDDPARDAGESFPQFCMSCEKQFVPANTAILYCSEACRLHDQAPAYTRPQSFSALPSISPPASPYQHQFSHDGPDIIPRFSPTQSRPRSYFNSEPYPSSYHHPTPTPLDTTTRTSTNSHAHSRSSTALASLRDLAAALPRSPIAPDSPPPSAASRNSSAVWDYIPFSHSKTSTPTATPANSYTAPQSYHPPADPWPRDDDPFPAVVYTGMDRPLPPRTGSYRVRNIDLVTPYSGW